MARQSPGGEERPLGVFAAAWQHLKLFPRLWRLSRPRRSYVLALVLLVPVNVVASLAQPYFGKILVDEVLVGKNAAAAVFPGVALTVTFGVMMAAWVVQGRLSVVVGELCRVGLRRRLFAHLMRLPVARHTQARVGDLLSRLFRDAEVVAGAVAGQAPQAASALLTLAAGLAVLLAWEHDLGLVAAGGGLVYLVLSARGFFHLRRIHRRLSELYGELGAYAFGAVQGVRTVKAYARERRETLTFTEHSHLLFRETLKLTDARLKVQVRNRIFSAAWLLLFVAAAGWKIVSSAPEKPAFTIGGLAACLYYLALVRGPVSSLVSLLLEAQQAAAAADRVEEILDAAPERLEEGARVDAHRLQGSLELRGVTFAYQPGRPVLKDVSLKLEPGQTLALVGTSGAGKSTVVHLMLGFYRPDSGSVRLDGQEVGELMLQSYRRVLGVVFQDEYLFEGTILDNVAFGSRARRRPAGEYGAEVEAAWRALEVADAAQFVADLPEGLATKIGHRAYRLAGGEKQRLALARAVFLDPPILLLDEATNQLDAYTEERIFRRLQEHRRRRTTLLISHRLSTVAHADRIAYLDHGVILEQGTHEELLARRGAYWALTTAQEKRR